MEDRKCSFHNCEEKHHAKGYCRFHYDRLKKKQCMVESCENKIFSKGLCSRHYQQLWKQRAVEKQKDTDLKIKTEIKEKQAFQDGRTIKRRKKDAPIYFKSKCKERFHYEQAYYNSIGLDARMRMKKLIDGIQEEMDEVKKYMTKKQIKEIEKPFIEKLEKFKHDKNL